MINVCCVKCRKHICEHGVESVKDGVSIAAGGRTWKGSDRS